MTLRLAAPDEAETLWRIRNLAIRSGCTTSYDADVIERWTPDVMPENYRQMIAQNPFYVVENDHGEVVATGYLDLEAKSVEAIFTLPEAAGKGMAKRIVEAIKQEAVERGITRLTLSSTPNAQSFYLKQGFVALGENCYSSRLANAELRCIDMAIDL
ncbi:GNAT family N-acetyltransferase [Enterobacteriaceae bacterium RIT714]|nr:GNAT family N-acetyltransferase [Enterobacteriaceae bacterium RIT714]